MKALFFWISALAMAIGLSAAHAAFAKPNNVAQAVATQESDNLRTQHRENTVTGPHRLYVAAQKTRKSGRSDTKTKKSSSCINGTTIHRKH
ncbi:MAG TPA: hypothetical protein VEI57_06630 [Nitrospirota bacterium]|nr:hypothetical protein [Nitrospirota bacterium]